VLVVGLHPRVRSGAAGAHYSSTGELPMIPGIDAVAQRSDGKKIYFIADDGAPGTMADKAVVDRRRSIDLPDDVEVPKVCGRPEPGHVRVVHCADESRSGRARACSSSAPPAMPGPWPCRWPNGSAPGRVVGAGRDSTRLDALASVGADDVVRLARTTTRRQGP